MKNKRWYKLDNCGKIFPPTTSDYDTAVFRIACKLKSEIIPTILQSALKETLIDYPVFNSILSKGFFWYYIDEVDNINRVSEENKPPCSRIYGVLYRVTYYKNIINLEVSHSLTDASGTTMFFKTLVSNYLKLKYDIQTEEEIDKSSIYEKSEDAFKKYYKKPGKFNFYFSRNAYKIKLEDYSDYRIRIIDATTSTSKIIELSKKYQCSISIYITSILIHSILLQMTEREKKRPIFITLPVNLRRFFPSNTIRNFFYAVSIRYKSNGEDKIEDIISNVKEQFEKNLTKEKMYEKMSETLFLENVFILRLVPRALKDFVLKTSFDISRKKHTMSFSNIGAISMPKVFEPYIEAFSFYSSTDGIQLNCCSYLDKFKFSFSSHFINAEIEKNFTRYLSEQGFEIYIDENILDEDEKLN